MMEAYKTWWRQLQYVIIPVTYPVAFRSRYTGLSAQKSFLVQYVLSIIHQVFCEYPGLSRVNKILIDNKIVRKNLLQIQN